jgi:hypothetical protein
MQPADSARSGTTEGAVVRWDDDRAGAILEAPGLPGEGWADAAVVEHSQSGGILRAGQVVELDWTVPGPEGYAYRATRVRPRSDLQATPGA